ncbi:hypothetical protein JMM65_19760 [Rhodovulum sulfidophilum]|nr:hypothetical protein [Rhodovulum sulfidophilum]
MFIRNACPAFFKPAHAVDHVDEASRSILSSVLAYDQGLINLFPEQAFPAPRHGFLRVRSRLERNRRACFPGSDAMQAGAGRAGKDMPEKARTPAAGRPVSC